MIRQSLRRLLLPYEQYVLSLAAEESAASAGTSAATPPKKRKISDASDLPFEVNSLCALHHIYMESLCVCI